MPLPLGFKHTAESRRKISENLKKTLKLHPRIGKPLTEQHKLNIGMSNKGKTWKRPDLKKRTPTQHPGWKGGKYYDRKGYVMVYGGKRGSGNTYYVREHRVAMETHLGRKLDELEEVHHINGIKDDNRIENLTIMVRGHHDAVIRCPYCLKNFHIR